MCSLCHFSRYPVLLQGETSVGKTSMINWLALSSGNVCVRINNHEHTDLQEYVGCYAADDTGKLVFKEGMLEGESAVDDKEGICRKENLLYMTK